MNIILRRQGLPPFDISIVPREGLTSHSVARSPRPALGADRQPQRPAAGKRQACPQGSVT
eukprot:1199606-Prymnesium_polylepis.1